MTYFIHQPNAPWACVESCPQDSKRVLGMRSVSGRAKE